MQPNAGWREAPSGMGGDEADKTQRADHGSGDGGKADGEGELEIARHRHRGAEADGAGIAEAQRAHGAAKAQQHGKENRRPARQCPYIGPGGGIDGAGEPGQSRHGIVDLAIGDQRRGDRGDEGGQANAHEDEANGAAALASMGEGADGQRHEYSAGKRGPGAQRDGLAGQKHGHGHHGKRRALADPDQGRIGQAVAGSVLQRGAGQGHHRAGKDGGEGTREAELPDNIVDRARNRKAAQRFPDLAQRHAIGAGGKAGAGDQEDDDDEAAERQKGAQWEAQGQALARTAQDEMAGWADGRHQRVLWRTRWTKSGAPIMAVMMPVEISRGAMTRRAAISTEMR